MFEGQLSAESVIVALSTAHFQIYQFQINFFVLYCFVKFLCILLFLFLMYIIVFSSLYVFRI